MQCNGVACMRPSSVWVYRIGAIYRIVIIIIMIIIGTQPTIFINLFAICNACLPLRSVWSRSQFVVIRRDAVDVSRQAFRNFGKRNASFRFWFVFLVLSSLIIEFARSLDHSIARSIDRQLAIFYQRRSSSSTRWLHYYHFLVDLDGRQNKRKWMMTDDCHRDGMRSIVRHFSRIGHMSIKIGIEILLAILHPNRTESPSTRSLFAHSAQLNAHISSVVSDYFYARFRSRFDQIRVVHLMSAQIVAQGILLRFFLSSGQIACAWIYGPNAWTRLFDLCEVFTFPARYVEWILKVYTYRHWIMFKLLEITRHQTEFVFFPRFFRQRRCSRCKNCMNVGMDPLGLLGDASHWARFRSIAENRLHSFPSSDSHICLGLYQSEGESMLIFS